MKSALIILCAFMFVGISEARWCVENATEAIVCCGGYLFDAATKTCKAQCHSGCPEASECVKPNICECIQGYSNRDDECKKNICDNCENGYCTDSGECKCNPNYVRSANTCKSICSMNCENGFCSATDVCECKNGYVKNLETNLCVPVCAKSCGGNSYCSAPEMCKCKSGFFGNAYDACKPWCEAECNNGKCVEPNVCECNPGYVKVDDQCSVLCKNCKLGDCVKEATCELFLDISEDTVTSEFSFTSESSTTDLSTSTTDLPTNCKKGCWAGTCLNGICQCPDVLILSKDENECIMPCEATCKRGICTQDNICQCPPGYKYTNGKECVPQCDKECVNSVCVGANQCECLEGYIPSLDPNLSHVCQPTCNGLGGELACINGTCSGVNKCQCWNGFEQNPKNRFECLPTTKKLSGPFYMYLLLGLLILLVMAVLAFLGIKKMRRDSYNVGKVEEDHGIVQYKKRDQHKYCVA